jgi:hypothetical protein
MQALEKLRREQRNNMLASILVAIMDFLLVSEQNGLDNVFQVRDLDNLKYLEPPSWLPS